MTRNLLFLLARIVLVTLAMPLSAHAEEPTEKAAETKTATEVSGVLETVTETVNFDGDKIIQETVTVRMIPPDDQLSLRLTANAADAQLERYKKETELTESAGGLFGRMGFSLKDGECPEVLNENGRPAKMQIVGDIYIRCRDQDMKTKIALATIEAGEHNVAVVENGISTGLFPATTLAGTQGGIGGVGVGFPLVGGLPYNQSMTGIVQQNADTAQALLALQNLRGPGVIGQQLPLNQDDNSEETTKKEVVVQPREPTQEEIDAAARRLLMEDIEAGE